MILLAWHTKTKLEAEGTQDFPSQICDTEITTQYPGLCQNHTGFFKSNQFQVSFVP